MKHYTEFDKKSLPEIRFLKNNKSIAYANIEAGFDIETTNTIHNGEKVAFSYIWMFGIGHGHNVYYGRTLEEFKDFMNTISKVLELNEKKLLPIYVHNFGFEFQFIRKYFDWDNVFSVKERKPIKASTNGLEFRDSLILSGKSLKKTGEDLIKHKVKKLDGYDYDLIRTPETELTEDELAYCKNDIQVITAYINEQIEVEGNILRIPMTNTSRVRRYVRGACYGGSGGSYSRYRNTMEDLQIGKEYHQLRRAFQGGFTHASYSKVNKVIKDVSSYDLSSSYPAVMVTEQFPMSRAIDLKVDTVEELLELTKKYCLVFDVAFKGLINTFEHESYISESKCLVLEDADSFNGRVYVAGMLVTTITDVDFDIIRKVYEWDSISIGNLKGYKKGKLPKPIIKSILDLYKIKTELKDVEGKEVEYNLSKTMLNSVYGMTVTDIINQGSNYETEWFTKENDEFDEIKNHNASRNRFLYYPWGVFVTAYARRNLWTGILSLGSDYCYSDTDAIKFINEEKNKPFIKAYNQMITTKVNNTITELELYEYLDLKNIYGEIKPLGIFEKDGQYDTFKSLGAKRYMFRSKKKYELVLAGLGKDNGMDYLKKLGNNKEKGIFEEFNNELYVPKEHTGNLTHIYIDHPIDIEVTDYLGKTSRVKAESSVYLEAGDFTLSDIIKAEELFSNLQNNIYLSSME